MFKRSCTGVGWARKSDILSMFIHTGSTVQSLQTSGVANKTGYSIRKLDTQCIFRQNDLFQGDNNYTAIG